jgi:hypothetical protein
MVKVAFRYGKIWGLQINWQCYYCSVDLLLRYTQITTKHVVIRAPANPEITHSAENIRGKLAISQGHTV